MDNTLKNLPEIPCNKIDPLDINAYFELGLDEINPAILRLDTSWGCTAVDLTNAVKQAETVTHLFLTPSTNPTALQFNREDYGRDGAENGGLDCITGDELSRIISMQLLKDVDQTQEISDGMVYMWNSITNLFEPWDLKTFAKNTNQTLEYHEGAINNLNAAVTNIQNTLELVLKRLTNLENRMTNVENRLTVVEADLTALKKRVSDIEGAIYNWPADKTTKIARGNTNTYGNTGQTVTKTRGIFTHDPNTNVLGDTYFSG